MLKLFKSKKTDYNYYSAFEEIASLIVHAAEKLQSDLSDYSLSSLENKTNEMHEIERLADDKKEAMMRFLYQDFLPPIEREDIIQMVYALDNILNNIEDILRQVDMYQIKSVESSMNELLALIQQASLHVVDLMKELKHFKSPKNIHALSKAIIFIEQEADAIYYQAVKQLHTNLEDNNYAYRYSTVYDVFEICFDSFEHLVNVVEAIVLKNT